MCCADTCWRRQAESESDEEQADSESDEEQADSESDAGPPLAKKQRTTDPQTNKRGGAHDTGQQFEIKMAAVIGLRGLDGGGSFELDTNVPDAGNFDDLVYEEDGRRYYLQLKHTENPDEYPLQPTELVELLHKCFESYYKIKDKDKS
jgi:hypothetical protein